jgi:hypothetical protein
MRWLRGAAWTVLLLDLVILAQLVYAVLAESGGPAAQAIAHGLAIMLGAGLLGIGILLAVSSWLRSLVGLWLGLVLGAIPLCWIIGEIIASEFE